MQHMFQKTIQWHPSASWRKGGTHLEDTRRCVFGVKPMLSRKWWWACWRRGARKLNRQWSKRGYWIIERLGEGYPTDLWAPVSHSAVFRQIKNKNEDMNSHIRGTTRGTLWNTKERDVSPRRMFYSWYNSDRDNDNFLITCSSVGAVITSVFSLFMA